MSSAINGANIILLIANGFNESEFAELQRALLKASAKLKTVAPENSLANGWLGKGWGHYFPVDMHISDALGSDFDMMILVGGSRSVAKLQQNPHTTRLIGHFLDAQKPIVALNEAVSLLCLPGRINGRRIAADPADAKLATSGAQIVAEGTITDRNLMTAHENDLETVINATLEHLENAAELVAA